MSRKIDFEQFLAEIHTEDISCTEDDVLDDDLPDAFDRWYETRTVDQMMEYFNAFIAMQDAELTKMRQEIASLRQLVDRLDEARLLLQKSNSIAFAADMDHGKLVKEFLDKG